MDGAAATTRGRRFAPRRLLQALGDERLIEHVRRGNDVAFEVLYDRHHRALLSFCRHMLGNREEAEDALQQTFLSAYRDLQQNDRPIKVQAWLFTIARNRCLSVLRARRESASDEIELSTAGLVEEVQQRADLRELLADMAELPEEQRAALVLSELGDLSHQEVGEVVGVETAKVKSLVFQARTALMESRDAREVSHEDIREQLSIPGATRRKEVKRHLAACPSCAAYWEDVRRQRALLGLVLPVVPTLGLKEGALAAAGIGAGGAGAAGGTVAGGAAAGGGVSAAIGSGLGAGQIAAIAIVAGGLAVGGGALALRDDDERPAGGADGAARAAPSASLAPGAATAGGAQAGGGRPAGAGSRSRARAGSRRGGGNRRGARAASPGPSFSSPPSSFAVTPAQPASGPAGGGGGRRGGGGAGGGGGGGTPPPDPGPQPVPVPEPAPPVIADPTPPCPPALPSEPSGGVAPAPC